MGGLYIGKATHHADAEGLRDVPAADADGGHEDHVAVQRLDRGEELHLQHTVAEFSDRSAIAQQANQHVLVQGSIEAPRRGA